MKVPEGAAAGSVPSLTARARRLAEGRAGTVLGGLLVALATWFVGFSNPAYGLDPSWGAGLYMAIEHGIGFGDDVVFTYGPLGFLANPVDWFTGLASIAYLWQAAVHIVLAIGLVWALRRTFGLAVAVVGGFLVLAVLIAVEAAFAIAAIVAFAALRRDRPPWALPALIVGAALFAAVQILFKLSIGPPLVAIFAVAVIGAGASRRQLAAFAAIFAAATVVLWLITGQSLGALPAYVTNGREIISGYSEAMLISNADTALHTLGVLAALAAMVGLIAGAWLGEYRDNRARWCAVLIAAIAGFSLFKEGVVRFDAPHIAAALTSMAVIWIALPLRARPALAAAGATLMIAVAMPAQLSGQVQSTVDRLNAVANAGNAFESAADLFDRDGRAQASDDIRRLMTVGYEVEPEMLADLEGRTVAIDPWEIAAAWAYDLDWDPLPVFQGYQANTRALDELNADRLASPEGPERILRAAEDAWFATYPGRAIDHRQAAWDPPGQALATLCNFEILETGGSWQLLGRVPDRCGEPELVASVEARYGEEVEVPQAGPGEVVLARIEGAGVSGLESVRSLLYRARMRFATVNDGRRSRLVPGTAADGLLMNGPPELVGSGPFEQAPQAQTIELSGPSGDLRYDFYAMSVEPTAGERAAARAGD